MIVCKGRDVVYVPSSSSVGLKMEISGLWYCAGAFILAVYIYGLRPLARYKARKFPGPPNAWLLGNAQQTLRMEQHHIYKEWADQYGPDPVAILFGSDTLILLGNPEDARKALLHGAARPTKLSQDDIMPRTADNDPGEMLIWARGEKWRSLKAAWQPVFFTDSLDGYMRIMDDAALLLVKEIEEHNEGKDKYFEIEKMLQSLTMSIIGQTAFGIELHTQKADRTIQTPSEKKTSEEVLLAAKHFMQPMGDSVLALAAKLLPFASPFLSKLAIWLGDPAVKHYRNSRINLRDAVNKLLEDHKLSITAASDKNFSNQDDSLENKALLANISIPRKNGSTGSQNGHINGTKAAPHRSAVKPGSFLDLLVRGTHRETGLEFSDTEKTQQVILMLLAGYETSANTMVFTLYLLSRACHAEKQEKVLKEIDSFGPNVLPTFEEIENGMPYLSACIKEGQRLFPTGHLLVREVLEDQTLAGYEVAKGQFYAISPFQLHHDKKTWGETVEDFIPERWLSDDPAQQKHCKQNFFGFGGGPRSCPGQRFALLEMKIVLLRIFQQFTLHLGPHQEPLPLRSAITIGAKDGLYLEARPRAQVNILG